ncbi:MAG: sigma-54 dependent transcriptional regulator [Desulfobacterota bacterium]|nr:sigma-54 dependent transcriptional regulator [Thermodesulfobacteriota bacterium]
MKQTDTPVVLVVDDTPGIREALERILEKEGFSVLTASDGEEAVKLLQQHDVALVLTDLKMPGIDGAELLKIAKTIAPEIEVVLITGHGTVDVAVEVMKEGAFDFIQKPFNKMTVVKIVKKAIEKRALVLENKNLHERLKDIQETDQVIGKSPAMRKVMELVEQVAPSTATVLITGESGVGKEVIARALHMMSPRRDKKFIKVSCAALPETLLEAELFGYERGAFTGAVSRREGRFELAHGGTLFLDEVGDINPAVQVKLLRVLQSGEFERLGGGTTFVADVRLIAATNASLKKLVEKKLFREDLYYRLNVINITIPPLRERREDIPLLANHFLRMYATKNNKNISGIAKDAMDILMRYLWPGNVRELENTIERAVVLSRGSIISPVDLPDDLRQAVSDLHEIAIGHRTISIPIGKMPLRDIERIVMEETLRQSKGNKYIASKILGISTRTLYRRIDSLSASDDTDADELAEDSSSE